MSVQHPAWGAPRRNRAAAAMRARLTGVALSALGHLGLITALALLVVQPIIPRIQSAVDVLLVPQFTLPNLALPRALGATSRQTRAVHRDAVPGRVRTPSPDTKATSPTAPGPKAPAPLALAPVASGSLANLEIRTNVRAALRATVGCTHARFLHLSEAEQEHCQQRASAFGWPAPDTPLAHIDPVKVAYFDAVAAAYKAPGHEPEMVCRFGGNAMAPPNGLQLGPLACQVIPPQGTLTEESGLSPP